MDFKLFKHHCVHCHYNEYYHHHALASLSDFYHLIRVLISTPLPQALPQEDRNKVCGLDLKVKIRAIVRRALHLTVDALTAEIF